jgi:uncharacterized membrane protein
MSTATATSMPPAPARRAPATEDEHVGFNGRVAVALTRGVGSMWSVYLTTALVLGWMALATFGPLHSVDPYPFPFLLFLGNVVQLLLVFVILVGQQVLGRAADKRALRTYEDAESTFAEVTRLHGHLQEQDKLLNRGVALVQHDAHPWLKEPVLRRPVRVRDQYVGFNGRVAAWITERVGSMWAFYVGAVFQFGWIGLAQVGVIRFDPYPFAFLLFLSSLSQLVLMFVIMVGQDVLGRYGDKRAQQTFLDTEAVLHECRRLQRHLTAQDRVISEIAKYIEENVPKDHPILAKLGHPAPDQEA